MPLRQLNRTLARGRICGTPKTGVKGSVIAATLVEGNVGYLYRYLSFPADNDKEYSGYIPSVPSGLTFEGNENSSFTAYVTAGGVYSVPVEVRENGVLLFTTSFNMVYGSNDVTISALVGAATADGALAIVTSGISPLLAATMAAHSTATANLTTAIPLVSALQAAASFDADLSLGAASMSAAMTDSAVMSGALTTAIVLASDLMARTTCAAALTATAASDLSASFVCRSTLTGQIGLARPCLTAGGRLPPKGRPRVYIQGR